jgi:glycosyltransferase involved in cell wall biosynthesis
LKASIGKILQLTTLHPRDDIRIRVKQCATLDAAFPGRVVLCVADGLGKEAAGGLSVIDLGRVGKSKMSRPFRGFARALKQLRSIRPLVLHFHDPELIPVGLAAKMMGIRVIYDVHEDLPSQLRGGDTFGFVLRHVLAVCASLAERVAAWAFDAIVCATPRIAERFPLRKTSIVQNFPIVAELATDTSRPYANRPPRFVYVGGITKMRCAREMVAAVAAEVPDHAVELSLAGPCVPQSLRQELEQMRGAANTRFLGWLDRGEVAELLATSRAGLVLFHEAPNHVSAQPNKLFEYMSAGLPVIASDFPLWRDLVESTESGLLVDPKDPQAIREAMVWVLEHPAEAEAMGRNGQQAVESRLNWAHEAKALIALYERIAPEYGRATDA